jgi:hypothetical protein
MDSGQLLPEKCMAPEQITGPVAKVRPASRLVEYAGSDSLFLTGFPGETTRPAQTALQLEHLPAALEAVIHPFPEFLAWLEMRNVLGGQCDRLARFRISADSRWTIMQGETAEPPDLDPLTACKCMTHLVKQTLYRKFDILVVQMTVLCRQNFY